MASNEEVVSMELPAPSGWKKKVLFNFFFSIVVLALLAETDFWGKKSMFVIFMLFSSNCCLNGFVFLGAIYEEFMLVYGFFNCYFF